VKELRLKVLPRSRRPISCSKTALLQRSTANSPGLPKSSADFHRLIEAGCDLREVFCFEKVASVSHDWTVRCENRFYQILKHNDPLPRPRQKVTVRRLLDGKIQLLYRDKKLTFKEIPPPAAPLRYTEPAVSRPAEEERRKSSTRPPQAILGGEGFSLLPRGKYEHYELAKSCGYVENSTSFPHIHSYYSYYYLCLRS